MRLTNYIFVIKLVLTEFKFKIPKKIDRSVYFMPQTEENSIFEIARSDTLRFRGIVIDVMSEACRVSDDEEEYDGIGRLAEKQMHAAIKRFICPDESMHEIPLDSGERAGEIGYDGKKIKKRRFVADILKDGTVYEIQTGPLLPLRDKIRWIFENTDYNVTVIHPIAETKWVNVLGSNGDVEKRYRSPIKGKISDIASELYAIKELALSPRFRLVILMMEAEQYVKCVKKSARSRPRYKKYELIPVNLLRAHIFRSVEDYKIFIPDSLEGEFTVKTFSSLSKIRGMDAYSAVHSLTDMGLLEECGKIGRAAAFKKTY